MTDKERRDEESEALQAIFGDAYTNRENGCEVNEANPQETTCAMLLCVIDLQSYLFRCVLHQHTDLDLST